MATVTKEKESKIQYLSDIIGYDNEPIISDMSKIPVFKVEGCEVMFSSLGAKTPKTGHSIRLLLPDDNFWTQDKKLRNKFLQQKQLVDDSIEIVKGVVKTYQQKDFLDGKISEAKVGRRFIDINITRALMYERTTNEKGEVEDTKIDKVSEATKIGSQIVVKYFRNADRWSGECLNPTVYKYDQNGDKVTSFISPKTKQETPLFVGTNDIVNVELRPYESINSITKEVTLKYNLLSVEIVQTAWDRGLNGKGGTRSTGEVKNKDDYMSLEGLSDVFGSFETTTTATTTQKSETKTETKKVKKQEVKEEVVEHPKEDGGDNLEGINEGCKPCYTDGKTPSEDNCEACKAKKEAETSSTTELNQVEEIDFSSLMNSL